MSYENDDEKIIVRDISKSYHVYSKPRDRLLQMFCSGEKKYYREFWALKDISLSVKRGETVGIIGRNGSGKSTLLQIICGTLTPTDGEVKVNGRIAALLELGSGFNPEFTGRENVYLNASLLGLTKQETDNRLNDILEFAEIGDFIDQPVKNYSSGMVVRLAFAVQAQVEPDILIIDEALAVGDAKFQLRCFNRLRQLKERGTSILLVTHSSEQIVTHCSRAILLEKGAIVLSGEPKNVVNKYMDLLFGKEISKNDTKLGIVSEKNSKIEIENKLSVDNDIFCTRPGYNHLEYRWGDGSAKILDFHLTADNNDYPSIIKTGQKIKLSVSVKFNYSLFRPILGVTIKNKEGVCVYGTNSELLSIEKFKNIGTENSTTIIEMGFDCNLAAGDYFISLGIATKDGEEIIPRDRRYDAIHLHIHPDASFYGLVNLKLNMNI